MLRVAAQPLQQRYSGRGFTVIGFPCNQFGAQEPGTADEIASFCSLNYEVTFPSKVDPDAPEMVAAIEGPLPPE
jgi:glutathione peroxidase